MTFHFLAYRTCVLSNSFFFIDTATTEIYTLSLHDALPIWMIIVPGFSRVSDAFGYGESRVIDSNRSAEAVQACATRTRDRKSTRLNSSHRCISYAVFCLKKKKKQTQRQA